MPTNDSSTGTEPDLDISIPNGLFTDEDRARAFIEAKRWPNGPICPHCQGEGYLLTAKPGSKHPVRPGVYKCKACREQFTVRIGTIFEESKLALSKWLMAIHLMTSSKKGVSSQQIARELGIAVKSAWFITHRIREAMKQEPLARMLQRVFEVDENNGGGEPRIRGTGKTFKMLADQWRRETGMLSSVTKIVNHAAYKAIIELGEPALPLILGEFRDRPNLWFPALKAIAKDSPVPPEDRQDPKLAREAWLTWGRKKGLIK